MPAQRIFLTALTQDVCQLQTDRIVPWRLHTQVALVGGLQRVLTHVEEHGRSVIRWFETMNTSFAHLKAHPFRNVLRGTGIALIAGLFLSGCESTTSTASTNQSTATGATSVDLPPAENLTLMSGDVIQISFPSVPDLNITQTIRRDGLIDLPLIDEVEAVGRTPDELEGVLMRLYEPQLVTSEVLVTVVSSSIPIFVSGSVTQPGKILVTRRITALEAIMEAGGPIMGRSDLKNVKVIRNESGTRKNYRVNVKDILAGEPVEPFVLKPSDIVFVPELKF